MVGKKVDGIPDRYEYSYMSYVTVNLVLAEIAALVNNCIYYEMVFSCPSRTRRNVGIVNASFILLFVAHLTGAAEEATIRRSCFALRSSDLGEMQ